MNQIILYHIWAAKRNADGKLIGYTLHDTVINLVEAQQICSKPDASYVYTFSEAWCLGE
jgi:hypothetical protein